MVVIIVALAIIIFLVVRFIIGASKRTNDGKDLGDSNAGNPVHNPSNNTTTD